MQFNFKCLAELVSASKHIDPEINSGWQQQFRMTPTIMATKNYYIYILTNQNNTTFYIGVTNNLERRTYEHKNGLIDGFSKKYKLKKVVYFEECTDIKSSIAREKQLKNWHR